MDSLAVILCILFAGLLTETQQFTFRRLWAQRIAPPPVVVPSVVPPPGPLINTPGWRSIVPPGPLPTVLSTPPPSLCQPCPCNNNFVPTLPPGGIPINYQPGFHNLDVLPPLSPTPIIENPDPNSVGISFAPNPTNMLPDPGLNYGCGAGFGPNPSCNPMFASNGLWQGANGVNIGMNPALYPQDPFNINNFDGLNPNYVSYPPGYGAPPDYGNNFEGANPFVIQPGFNENGFGNALAYENGYGGNCIKICCSSLVNRFSYGFKTINGLPTGFDGINNFPPPNFGLVGQPYGNGFGGPFDYNGGNGFQYAPPFALGGPFGAGNVSGFPSNFSLRKVGDGQSDESSSSITNSGMDLTARKIEERSTNSESQGHIENREKLLVVKAPRVFRLLQDRSEH